MILQSLGMQAGVDSESPAGIVVAHPKHIGAKKWTDLRRIQELLVLAVPFTDRGKMAGNFGLSAKTLQPDKMVRIQGNRFFGGIVYVHNKMIYLGNNEKAIASVANGKPLGQALLGSVREVHIRAPKTRFTDETSVGEFKSLLGRFNGNCLTYLHLALEEQREAVFLLGDSYRVAPTEAFISEVERLFSPASVDLR